MWKVPALRNDASEVPDLRTGAMPSGNQHITFKRDWFIAQYENGMSGLFRVPNEGLGRIALSSAPIPNTEPFMPMPVGAGAFLRAGDSFIEGQVAARIAMRREDRKREFRPLSVLEIGAGTSYSGMTSDWGAPWLSRYLVKAYEGAVEVTATDRNNGNYCKIELARGQAWLSEVPHTNVRLSALRKNPEAQGFEPDSTLSKDGKTVFIRPTLDPEFEQRIFGLHVEEVRDFRNLGTSLKRGQYDVIFARHMNPTPAPRAITGIFADIYEDILGDRWRTVAKKIIPFLAKDGEAFIFVDTWTTERTVLYHAHPNGVERYRFENDGSLTPAPTPILEFSPDLSSK